MVVQNLELHNHLGIIEILSSHKLVAVGKAGMELGGSPRLVL